MMIRNHSGGSVLHKNPREIYNKGIYSCFVLKDEDNRAAVSAAMRRLHGSFSAHEINLNIIVKRKDLNRQETGEVL